MKKRPSIDHRINMTPFMDVLLVLLVVFMIFAAGAISHLEVNLPSAKSSSNQSSLSNTIDVVLTANGDVSLNGKKIPEFEFLSAISSLDRGCVVRIYADTSSMYGFVARIMGIMTSCGYTKINLMIKSE
ncbi:ExbD/TolR family protein [Candidatus Gromoviella agglomerans]|uniref:ExbD/TolR family protein n=1 Tax=Candidatus Gromoviella agglomerans TaxID=2806609 RepID=UPI001E4B3B62|nr:biopolymer transporter ExbD [Candidatus Gromoviella agglomerans]UFX98229.1 Biopolymer transport protein ExbD [Candidatus Gromoviella agglomerans]